VKLDPEIGTKYKIIDKQDESYDRIGIVVRVGYAGEVLLYHLQVNGLLTVRTFVKSQLLKQAQ